MFYLFYGTARYAVASAVPSLSYAAPAIAVFCASAWLVVARNPHPAILSGLIVLVLLSNTVFIVALARRMALPESPPGYRRAMRWRRMHTNFFVLLCFLFVLLAALFFYFSSSAVQLLEFADELSLQRSKKAAQAQFQFGAQTHAAVLFIAGSKLIAALFLILALLLWLWFYRLCIKIPAHAAGYYLSNEEVGELTRGARVKIFCVSLTVNGGVSGVATWLLPEETLTDWQFAVISTFIYWLGVHVNVSLWTALYDHFTEGYQLRREIN